MKEIILGIIEKETNGTKITNYIKSKPDLRQWVEDNSCDEIGFAERVYNSVFRDRPSCDYGNLRKFKTITTGYGYCGRADKCKCQRDNISKKVSALKQSYTVEKKQEINNKRVNSNLKKYGVPNAFQTSVSEENRKEYYSDKSKVDTSTEKAKITRKEKYGDENYCNYEKAKETNLKKYGVEHYVCSSVYKNSRKNSTIAENTKKELMYDDEAFIAFVSGKTPSEVSEYIGYVNSTQVVQRLKRLGITDYIRGRIVSNLEKDVLKYISSVYSGEIITNIRSILDNRELDIYLPELKIAVEVNGIYWHSDVFKDKRYHYKKYIDCKRLGINLIQVYEHLWNVKQDIIKDKLNNLIGCNSTYIHGRKCIIKQCSAADSREFLNVTHIQGYSNASVKLGLYYDDVLVAIMTFSKKRHAIGKAGNYWELVRYSSKERINGGASKLFYYFIKNHHPERVLSYSLNDWGTGNLYRQLGFLYDKDTSPSYWYVNKKTLEQRHRYAFAKHKLINKGYDSSLTEFEITDSMGLLRYWDSGSGIWEWNNEWTNNP